MLKQQRGAAAVMDMSLFVLLLLSGLVCSTSGFWREYHYVNTTMSWTAAQSYCRERFTDLATVDSMDDVNRMMNTVNDGYNRSAWIGLKRATESHWAWSVGNHSLARYNAWCPGQPNGDGRCVSFAENYWYDRPCPVLYYFVCYDESSGYIMIRLGKNWTDAQSYCRQYHSDLATISSPEEQDQIHSLSGSIWVWIGLFLDSWQWSDQWNLTFRNWAVGQQFQISAYCVAMSRTGSGKWIQYGCDQKHPFICYGEDKLVKKQTFRLNLSHDGNYDLTDSSIQTDILNKISEKVQDMGLVGFKNISWIKDASGEVFHPNTPTDDSNDAFDECIEDE